MTPAEAVDAAMKGFTTCAQDPGRQSSGDVFKECLTAALEAAAPYIEAAALRQAAEHLEYGNPINQWLSDRADEIEAGTAL